MTDTEPAEEATLFPRTAGEQLRGAREAMGLSLAEVAARTRVPVRQLEAIEQSNFAALPSITYSVGFAKAYARAVGLDEAAIARDVRGAVDKPSTPRRTEYEAYEIEEPARGPSRWLVIGALVVAVLLLAAVALWYGTSLFRGEDGTPPVPVIENSVPEAPGPAVSAGSQATAGPVVLTATDDVWLKVYEKGRDGVEKTLRLGTLKPGESYTIPSDAVGPMINVGRPDKLAITVGGTAVAPLGDGRRAIKDVAIDATSLTARSRPQTEPTSGASSGPTAAVRPTGHPTASVPRTAPSSAAAPLNIAAPAAPEPAPSATPAP